MRAFLQHDARPRAATATRVLTRPLAALPMGEFTLWALFLLVLAQG